MMVYMVSLRCANDEPLVVMLRAALTVGFTGRAVSIDKRGIVDMKDDHEDLDMAVFKFSKAAG